MGIRRKAMFLLAFMLLNGLRVAAQVQQAPTQQLPAQQPKQSVVVRSGFFQDSLMIGDKTGYYLTAEYPTDLNILFPDSTFSFAPFEYEQKLYFPTKTKAGKSYDSVVYYLSTFEVEKRQSLSLPIFQLNPRDCTTYTSDRDTILLSEMVKNVPDSIPTEKLPLKVSTAYEKVSYLFNYPVLALVVIILLIVVIFVWIFFGKKIRRYYKLKRMLKSHRRFLEEYASQVEKVRGAFSKITTESALLQWKKYMEELESRPYTKLTTLETARLENHESLVKNLRAIDGAIYGNNTNVIESLENLRTEADQRFERKIKEVQHG